MITHTQYLDYLPYALNEMQEMYLPIQKPSPIFIPRKHTKLKYADHKQMKAKRKNLNR